MKRILYLCIGVLLFSFTSCYQDLGNYDYNRLPELRIDNLAAGSWGEYKIFENVTLNPVVVFGKEGEDAFDIAWYLEKSDTLQLVSKELELNVSFTEVGKLPLILEIYHKELGISMRRSGYIYVFSDMARGFYILKETAEGDTEMDLHAYVSPDSTNQDIMGNAEYVPGKKYKFYSNLISMKMGQPLKGKPIELDHWDWKKTIEVDGELKSEVYRVMRPVSENDIAMFHVSDLSYLGGIPELFYDLKESGTIKINALKSTEGTSLIFYNDGEVRSVDNRLSGYFGFPASGEYKLTPDWAAADRGSVLVYDELTSSFKYIRGSGKVSSFLYEKDYLGEHMPMNNWDANLKFFEKGNGPLESSWYDRYNHGIAYALLEKKNNSDSLFLCHITLNMLAMNLNYPSSYMRKIDTLSSNSLMARGGMHTVHSHEKLLFFNVGTRVYSYNIETGKEEMVIAEADYTGFDGLPDEITYMKYLNITYENSSSLGYYDQRLYVGGYKNGNYTLYGYKIVAGKIDGEPQIWKGEGKMKSMRYAAPGSTVGRLHIYQ